MYRNKFKYEAGNLVSKLIVLVLMILVAPNVGRADIRDFIRKNGATINNYRIITYDIEYVYSQYYDHRDITDSNDPNYKKNVYNKDSEHHCFYILMNSYGDLFLSLSPWISKGDLYPEIKRTVLLNPDDDYKTLSMESGINVYNLNDYSGDENRTTRYEYKGTLEPMLFNKQDSTISVMDDKKFRFSVNDDYSLSLIPREDIPEGTEYGIGEYREKYSYYESKHSLERDTTFTDEMRMYRNIKFNIMDPQFYPKDCEPKRMMIHYDRPIVDQDTQLLEYEHKSIPAYAVIQNNTYYLMFTEPYSSSYVIRGNVIGNKVSFPQIQFASLDIEISKPEYLKCESDQTDYYDYFCSSIDPTIVYNKSYRVYYVTGTVTSEPLLFDYDPETLCLTGTEGTLAISYHNNMSYLKPLLMMHPEVLEAQGNGVANVNDDTRLSVVDGRVVLSRPGSMEVYSTDGREVAADYGISLDLTTLGHGIFIVRAGDKTRKVRL